MSKKTELAKNTLIITVGKICTQFFNFFLLPLYTAFLSPDEYGIADLVITYTTLFMPIVILQLDQAVFRFLIDVRNDEKGKRKNISSVLLFLAFLIVLVSALFLIIQIFVDSQFKWYLLFNLIACMCSSIMLQISRGLGDNKTYSIGSFITAIVQLSMNVVLLAVFNLGVISILISPVIGNLVASAFVFLKKRLYKFISISCFDIRHIKSLLKYSVPLIPNSLSWWVLSASDRTIVSVFLGPAMNGILSVSHKFSGAFSSIYTIFNMSWTESVSLHIDDEDNNKFFSEIINSAFMLFSSAAIGIVAVMPFVFDILINSEYSMARMLIPLFMISAVLNVVQGLYSCVYVALKKTAEIAKSTLISAAINIVAHLALIHFIGIYAAPVSTIIGYGVMVVYRYFDIKKYINVPLLKKNMICVTLMFSVVLITYYLNNMIFNVISLALAVLFALYFNKEYLILVCEKVFKKGSN